jgi:acyl-coenzyme A thioesterase PaaI-like protein
VKAIDRFRGIVAGTVDPPPVAKLIGLRTFTTLELKTSFLKPVWQGRLVAVAHVLKAGRTIGLVECRVTDEHGSLVAYASSTVMTLRGDVAQGR